MKIKEITCSLSGTIPSGAYENLKPGYSMVIELEGGEDWKKVFNNTRDHLREMFELEVNRAKADLIDKQYAGIRFYEKDGKKYPSVTSILSWNTDWRLTEDELNQYGSRGTIVHKLIEIYLNTGKWEDPNEIPELAGDVAIVCGGSKGLHWDDCSHKAFFEANGKDIEIEKMEQEVINTEAGYGGRYDALGSYKGVRAIFDFKAGSVHDFRQTSAYGVVEGVERMVICPVGATENKSGFMKPKVNDNVKGEYEAFLKARAIFRRRFGI